MSTLFQQVQIGDLIKKITEMEIFAVRPKTDARYGTCQPDNVVIN